MALELTFLGSGNAFAPGGLCWNGFLVGGRYLFEAPPQSLASLNRLGRSANEIEAVILSHHHGDHFLGVPFLLLQGNYFGRTAPLTIVGPAGTKAVVMRLCRLAFPGLTGFRFPVRWAVARPGRPMRVGALQLEPVAMQHDPKLALCLGFHCELDGRRFAYTGDTGLCEGVFDLDRRAEVLVSECATQEPEAPIHMSLRGDIPAVRAAMPRSSSLVLTHLGPGVTAEGLARTRVARDLATFRF